VPILEDRPQRTGSALRGRALYGVLLVVSLAVHATPTPGYNLLKAELSYTTRPKQTSFGPQEVTVGITGNNLLNEDMRNSVSFKKDEVLLPGRNVKFFANVKF
jgi:iron complex outermembrane receptor protein